VVDLLLVLIELFSPGLTVKALLANIGRNCAVRKGVGHFERKFQEKREVMHQRIWRQKTRVPGLSRGVVCVILIVRLAVLIQYRRVTHRQTDTQTHRHTMMAITRAGKNCTDSTVDNNHALHTHEALHGMTAIKFYVNLFCLGCGGSRLWGPWAAAPLAHWVIQDWTCCEYIRNYLYLVNIIALIEYDS